MSGKLSSKEGVCPVCNSADISPFFEIFQVPVHCNLLLPTRDEAIHAPRGDIRLGFCRGCGHISNRAFDLNAMQYGQDYENSLHFSPRFQDYVSLLATRLIDRYDLHNKDIIEIGFGKGDFLILLCELGGNRGIGFDPSYVPEPAGSRSIERITFIQDFYSERYASYGADLICCRQVLEHIQFPREFLLNLRQAIGSRHGTIVFFEVPNVMFTLRDLAIWDLIYEHCSYFSAGSLDRLFRSCGFEVLHLKEAFEGQFLCIEAVPADNLTNAGPDNGGSLEEIYDNVATFADRYETKVKPWKGKLEGIDRSRERATIWGVGARGVTFLNTLKVQEQIEYVIDINPRKQGMYVAGTGQKIMPPEFLREYDPDLVIVMNPIYLEEIRQYIKSLDLSPRILSA